MNKLTELEPRIHTNQPGSDSMFNVQSKKVHAAGKTPERIYRDNRINRDAGKGVFKDPVREECEPLENGRARYLRLDGF
jgi:hypothetical protein